MLRNSSISCKNRTFWRLNIRLVSRFWSKFKKYYLMQIIIIYYFKRLYYFAQDSI